MHPGGGNNPCGRKKQARDAFDRWKSSLWSKRGRQRCIRLGQNNPCGTKEQDRDASGRWKSSLWKKRGRQRCIRAVEIIPVEQKRKIEMNPGGGNNPCGAKEEGRDADFLRISFCKTTYGSMFRQGLLLNNRLLLKGITFTRMCVTFWQEPFYIKKT